MYNKYYQIINRSTTQLIIAVHDDTPLSSKICSSKLCTYYLSTHSVVEGPTWLYKTFDGSEEVHPVTAGMKKKEDF